MKESGEGKGNTCVSLGALRNLQTKGEKNKLKQPERERERGKGYHINTMWEGSAIYTSAVFLKCSDVKGMGGRLSGLLTCFIVR